MRRTEWVTPARGLWIPVPPEYRGWGGPPALEFIADMMRFLEVDYYVGWLSAAAMYGAAHQVPQVTQIATARRVRARKVGGVRLELYQRNGLSGLPTRTHTARTGPVQIATPELTVLDLTRNVLYGAGLDVVATAIVELTHDPGLDMTALTGLALRFPVAAVRRAGWILDTLAGVDDLEQLRALSDKQGGRPSRLSPQAPDCGSLDQRWRIRINREIEVEV